MRGYGDLPDAEITCSEEELLTIIGRAGERGISEAKIMDALRRRCVICGRLRTYGSVSRCRSCYKTFKSTPE